MILILRKPLILSGEQRYISRIVERLQYEEAETAQKMKELETHLEAYMELQRR